ncbi:hypothetical protein ACCC88_13135 [Sphingomonas sp. Sphisp140]|uniref:hypothetical protein n=1 Tax=unclassified Sphingomonas TaxID=196159 RepID=UPI0039AF95EC
MAKQQDGNDAEHRLLSAWEAGEPFDAAASGEREIQASVLRGLIIGTRKDFTAAPGRLVLRNATIVGELDLSYLLAGSMPSGALPALRFEHCEFEKGVLFNKSTILSLTLSRCTVPQLSLMNSHIDGDLDLSGSTLGAESDSGKTALRGEGLTVGGRVAFTKIHGGNRFISHGPIRLVGARIGGNFEAVGATLSSGAPNKSCLVLDGAEIEGSVFLQASRTACFEALGSVSLRGATIKRDLCMFGAVLDGDGRSALFCHRAVVQGAIRLSEDGPGGRPFKARGALNLSDVSADTLEITGARLAPAEESRRSDTAVSRTGSNSDTGSAGIVLDLRRASIVGALRLHDLQRLDPSPPAIPDGNSEALHPPHGSVDGRFDLSDASVGVLEDDPATSWPGRGKLVMDGFVYGRIAFAGGEVDKAGSRLGWLDLQYSEPPGPDKFKPQPFEQLAKVLREHGYTQDADRVAMQKRDWAIRCKAEKGINSVLARAMQVTAGHGYSRFAAICWTIGWWFAGLALIYAGERTGVIKFQQSDEALAKGATIVLDRADKAGRHAELVFNRESDTCDNLFVPLYALELMVPIVELGQISECEMKAVGRFYWITVTARALFQIIGAMLITVLGVTLTGLLRRD